MKKLQTRGTAAVLLKSWWFRVFVKWTPSCVPTLWLFSPYFLASFLHRLSPSSLKLCCLLSAIDAETLDLILFFFGCEQHLIEVCKNCVANCLKGTCSLLLSPSLNQISVLTSTWTLGTDQQGSFLSAKFSPLSKSSVNSQINLQHAAWFSSATFVFKILVSLKGCNILFTVTCFSIWIIKRLGVAKCKQWI